MKRILIHTLVFGPDGVSTAYLYNDIAAAFAEAGWQVDVVTTTPHFNPPQPSVAGSANIFAANDPASLPGIRVRRVPMKRFRHIWSRMAGFVWWHLASFFIILFSRKPDVILSPSPPPTIGFLNLCLGWLKRCKVVYNVQEIYPDILQDLHGLPLKVLRWMERRIYDGSDAIVTIDSVFRDTIAPRFKDPSHLHIIPNFVDTDFYRPLPCPDEDGPLRLLYAGNVGLAQDWDMLLALAEKTRDLPLEYLVVGDGLRKNYLREAAAARGLSNIVLQPYTAREEMPRLLSESDLNFIFMEPRMDRQGFPSKVYSIMSCARPLLVSSGESTPIVNFLAGHSFARLETDPDIEARLASMESLLRSLFSGEGSPRKLLRDMGRGAREIIEQDYSRQAVTAKYIKLMEELTR